MNYPFSFIFCTRGLALATQIFVCPSLLPINTDMGILAKISEFFTVKKPYPDWAYASPTQRQVATLIDMVIVYPITYLAFRYEIGPAIVRTFTDPNLEVSTLEQFLLEMSLEAFVGILILAGWWSIPLLFLMVFAFLAVPLALYHLMLEASPLRASIGKVSQGFWVVKKRGDSITFWNAMDRFFERVIILPHVIGPTDYDMVKRDAPRIN